MTLPFIHSFQSERLKTKRSLASWIVIIGAFFTPVIITVARLVQYDKQSASYASADFWNNHWNNVWQSMALFLLPLGIILFTSLITQIEYKNNTWKQLHTLPLKLSTVFLGKLAVIMMMVLQFFLLFNLGIYLSALVPYLLINGVPYPKQPIPYLFFLQENALFFIDCLPIVALQYLLSLRFKNFLVPVGVGFIWWIGAMISFSWQYSYIIPYTHGAFNFFKYSNGEKNTPPINLHYLSIAYFLFFTVLNYIMYIAKKDKS